VVRIWGGVRKVSYYYFWLFVGIGMALYFSLHGLQRIREALILQVFGYLTFILPTAIVNTLNPKTISGIPSIMCGFAVLYALILVFGIVPRTLTPKSASGSD
jgi:Na+-driven multidrug efflux pump